MSYMKALLPLAGKGTRMYPLGLHTPKCLLPILNKPILIWTFETLAANSIKEVVLVVDNGEFGQKIREFVGQSKAVPTGMSFQFAVQEEQRGTADVVQAAKSFFSDDEEFVLLYGDDLYGAKNVAQLMSASGLAIVGVKVSDPEKYGIIQVDEQNRLIQILEKPNQNEVENNLEANNLALVNIGCMKLNARVFKLFEQLQPSARGEYELTDTLKLLAKETPIQVLENSDYWLPIGYPWHLLNATEFLAPRIESKIEGTVENNVTIKGKVILPKSSVIKAGTYIEGNVIVSENSVIGPNAYLRENVVIGSDCKVGFCVEIKNSLIGNKSPVPHLSYIGDSILGENVNFAGGSMVTNWRHDLKNISTPVKGQIVDTGRQKFGTVIGENVKLGAGTIIYPGRKLWPNTTTLPGQIVDKDIENE